MLCPKLGECLLGFRELEAHTVEEATGLRELDLVVRTTWTRCPLRSRKSSRGPGRISTPASSSARLVACLSFTTSPKCASSSREPRSKRAMNWSPTIQECGVRLATVHCRRLEKSAIEGNRLLDVVHLECNVIDPDKKTLLHAHRKRKNRPPMPAVKGRLHARPGQCSGMTPERGAVGRAETSSMILRGGPGLHLAWIRRARQSLSRTKTREVGDAQARPTTVGVARWLHPRRGHRFLPLVGSFLQRRRSREVLGRKSAARGNSHHGPGHLPGDGGTLAHLGIAGCAGHEQRPQGGVFQDAVSARLARIAHCAR